MRYFVLVLSVALLSCGNTYYIVRHAEKATPMDNATDVPLTKDGGARAEELKLILKKKNIQQIFSTNTIRTKATAQPTADFFSLPIDIYGPRPDSAFINLLKSKKKNILVVGHSNTVDDIVNMLCSKSVVPGDLKDSEYDNLFVVKRKGKRFVFKAEKYGAPPK
jgi:phosphohistidine phosphatase SixA